MTSKITNLRQKHIDFLIGAGVPPSAMIKPAPLQLAEIDGASWICVPEIREWVFWQPRTGDIRPERGTTFALGEENIFNPAATALDQWLSVYADPLRWLQASRQGIVVLRWSWAFDMLRDVQRIAIDEPLIETYKRHMRPRLPQLAVIPNEVAA